MNLRALALFSAVVGIFLLITGSFATYGLILASDVEPYTAASPYDAMIAENIARIQEIKPFLYLSAAQGLGLGSAAFFAAVALWTRRLWAVGFLVACSILLVVTAVVLVAATLTWSIQALYIAWCALLWWEAWRTRSRHPAPRPDQQLRPRDLEPPA